jgi:hypothetical protein
MLTSLSVVPVPIFPGYSQTVSCLDGTSLFPPFIARALTHLRLLNYTPQGTRLPASHILQYTSNTP